MPAPTVTASLNKSAYAIGETMTLTVNYSDADRQNITINIEVVDSAGNKGTTTATAVLDPSTITVTSTPARTWTKQSDNGSVATFTAVA